MVLILVLLSFYGSFMLVAKFNYGYPMFYHMLDMQQHIDKYAVQNDFSKQDFVLTDQQQRTELFSQIVKAVHSSGEGLEQITFTVTNGNGAEQEIAMLTSAEVIHLQDVANLINNIHLLVVFLLIILIALLFFKPKQKADKKSILLTLAATVLSLFICFYNFGATAIFYWLHEVIFPDNHQWFFYYQESLMSTSMKAPDLFLAIGALMLLVAVPTFLVTARLILKISKNTKFDI